MAEQPLSDVERIKSASRLLRGTLAEGLADTVTGAISDDDTQLIKFHGSYQQDDRDVRDERRKRKLEPDYQFMLRTRLPGGICTPEQWLKLDSIAREYANHSLRITTRQAFQLHGVIKWNLKQVIREMDQVMLDTFAACGDVNRNVMCAVNPYRGGLYREVTDMADKLSLHLLPKTGAYHEIWLDGKKLDSGPDEHEPIYGDTYLPRKFKTVIAMPPVNDVDVFAHDLGFIAIVEDDRIAGYNVTVGGGMGVTYAAPETYPRLANVIGFVTPEQVLDVAGAVVTTQRDFGNRSDRKLARLKYTIDRMGLDAFVNEVQQRSGVTLAPQREFTFTHTGDQPGWVQGDDGLWHLTLQIPSGRIKDTDTQQSLSGLRAVAKTMNGSGRAGFVLTPNQNLVIANIAVDQRSAIDDLLAQHGMQDHYQPSLVRQHTLACVAFPTCGQAMAEAERYMPEFLDRFETMLAELGLQDKPIVLRMTGCPNGCARPYMAEIGLTGKAPGRYNLYLGGGFEGQRLNQLYRENIGEDEIFAELKPLLAQYAEQRQADEYFGDFLHRANLLPPEEKAA